MQGYLGNKLIELKVLSSGSLLVQSDSSGLKEEPRSAALTDVSGWMRKRRKELVLRSLRATHAALRLWDSLWLHGHYFTKSNPFPSTLPSGGLTFTPDSGELLLPFYSQL